ncbi:CGNR zinc finger domain-containing protein [Actinomadura hibisca]|uniref:CGNR zinc finger domain-containing protein n=1 Tax=Actinomadura hibisca TaxID=68565 RepID=UPI00082DD82E|nr:CGNR zinc finger domain-containing protein [Actinomadura hibisca]
MRIPITDYAPAVTFANALVSTSPTVRLTGDALPTPQALQTLLTTHNLATPPPTPDDLFNTHLLRREVRGIIETETEEQAVAGATVLIKRAGLAPLLDRDATGRWQWYVPTTPNAPLADELAAFIATGLFGAIRALGHGRFRPCAAPDCRGVFIDISKAGRRRYCMPDLCGNRQNVANHRARHQEESTPR